MSLQQFPTVSKLALAPLIRTDDSVRNLYEANLKQPVCSDMSIAVRSNHDTFFFFCGVITQLWPNLPHC